MFVANQSIDFRLSASYWSKALSHLLDCSSTRTPRHQYFVAFPSSEISSTTKQKLYWNRLTLLNKDLQFLLVEGLEEFFCGNSRNTSDCPVCSMLKTLSGCSMLLYVNGNCSEFVYWSWRSEWIVKPDLPCCDLQPSSRVIPRKRSEWSLSREPRRFMINSLAKTTRQITFHIICISFQVVFLKITPENLGLLTQFVKK